MKVRNRFKGLDLIYRVPDELWNEVCDTAHETGRPSPWKRNVKKQNGCQIAVKRREEKSKREKERYKHLNAEFKTIARR